MYVAHATFQQFLECLYFLPQVVEIMRHPKRHPHEVRSLTDSVVGKEEEERHQKLLTENEQLKKQISEVCLQYIYFGFLRVMSL